MNDLFQNKSQQLLTYCKQKDYVSKADIMQWGLQNYYLRADRTVRDLVSKGQLRKLSKDECAFRGLKGRMAYYENIQDTS